MLRLPIFLSFLLFSLPIYTLVGAKGSDAYGNDGGNDDSHGGGNNDGNEASQTSSAPLAVGTSISNLNGTSGLQGDSQCPGSQLVCVVAFVNGSTTTANVTVTYVLQSTRSQFGWMAIGFGSQMANSPMVIMWPNADGTITLSQRQAPAEVTPTPVTSPAKVATVATPLSTPSGSQPKLAFTIEGSVTQQPLIWAFGTTRPGSAPDSPLEQHLDSGAFSLNLAGSLSSINGTAPATSGGSAHIPLLPYQKTIVAHAVVVTFGFLFLLPAGALLARYTRTISSRWFKGHWIIQAGIGGPVIIVGCILGFLAVHQQGSETSSPHKTLGKVLLGLYLTQCFLGAFIHYVKIPFRFGRPPQNYFHAILGLLVIGLALYQVRLGYDQEWPKATGRGSLGNGINIVWFVWVILLAVLYFGGLAFLPRQWRQERAPEKHPQEYRLTSNTDSQDKLSERFL